MMEMVVTVIVLGILAGFAVVGYRSVIDRGVEQKQLNRTAQVLREARALYLQRSTSETAYTWEQAVADAVDDLPQYKTNSMEEYAPGVAAVGGSKLNNGANGWTVSSDTGSAVYSSGPNDIVISVSNDTVYVASAQVADTATRGVFGFIARTGAPRVWAAACSGSTCDAESASSGPPSSGSYASGTTTPTTAAVTTSSTTTTTTPTTTTTIPVGSSIPAGVLVWYAGSTAPTGWLVADGTAVSRSSYSALFSSVGTSHGTGDGSTTFNLPNLKGRVAVSQDSGQTEFDVVGETGGSKTVTLTVSQLPTHTHTASMTASGQANEDPFTSFMRVVGANGGWLASNHMPGYTSTDSWQDLVYPTFPQHYHSFSLTSSATTSSAGSGGAHQNLQPYVVLTPLVATGSSSRIEAGMIVPTTSTSTPAGWAEASGGAVSRSTYASLFSVLSTTYGAGDGSTTFNLPNTKGRAVVGRDTSQTEFDTLSEIGGAKTTTLTSNEMPSHDHVLTLTMNGNTADGGASTGYRIVGAVGTWMHYGHFAGWSGGAYNDAWGGAFPQHYHSISLSGSTTTSAEGGSGSHNELQPYRVVRYLIATGTSSKIQQDMLLMNSGTASMGADFTSDFTSGSAMVGQDTSQTEFDVLGETGGTKTESLTLSQIPSHSHTVSMTFSGYTSESATYSFMRIVYPTGLTAWGNHTLGYTSGGYGDAYSVWFTRHYHSASASASGTTSSAGSGSAHQNLQPYSVVKVWRYTNTTELPSAVVALEKPGGDEEPGGVPVVLAVLAGAALAWGVERVRGLKSDKRTVPGVQRARVW